MLMVTTCTSWRSFTISCSFCRCGSSSQHGTHHVAHTLSSVVFPLKSDANHIFPVPSRRFISGSGLPRSFHAANTLAAATGAVGLGGLVEAGGDRRVNVFQPSSV